MIVKLYARDYVARGAYRCAECGEPIEPAGRYHYAVVESPFDGSIMEPGGRARVCGHCADEFSASVPWESAADLIVRC
ncbi:MAG: hypothetical protein ACE5PT_12300 [Gemmatimonadales bacterium]